MLILLLHVLTLLLLSYVLALIAWPLLSSGRGGFPFIPDMLVVVAIVLAAFLARQDSAPVRAVLAISGLLVLLRVHSYGSSPNGQGFFDYVRFLSFGLVSPHLIYSSNRPALVSRAAPIKQIGRILFAILLILLTWSAASRLITSGWGESSWLLNHLILVAAFTLVMTAFGQCATVSWQIQGNADKVLVDKIYLSRTPAEFWRRWSWPMHIWLYRHVYIPVGGKPHHLRATLAVFTVSGILHEFIAALVIGRITGHQMIFFILSGIGVLASPSLEKLEERGRAFQAVSRILTVSFLATTSCFMFATLDYIVPVYYKHVWLRW
ncbi:MAG: hypothetical protein M3O30_19375 [Planctomycetota bacterium]|nr:hypothetical protein [Planctomycetota bacterium]